MIENDIYTYLLTDATLIALIGTDSDGNYKIYPEQAPQGTATPFVLISNDIGATQENIDEDRIQITVVGTTKAETDGIRDRLKVLLDKEDGIQDVLTSTTNWFYYSKLTAGYSMVDKDAGTGSDQKFYVMHFSIKYNKKS